LFESEVSRDRDMLVSRDKNMSKTIVIDPITRIEGHAKISIFLDDVGEVEDARFHVVEYRGFEKFCEGRPFTEMAGITARICGICPVSHLLASAKTGDKILAVQIPIAAEKLRRLMNLAQITQSHALSFFHLSSPDFLLGWDSDPSKRNIFGLIEANPDVARAGIRLRQFGQTVIELLGAKKIHAAWAVPGGVRSPLSEEGRQWIRDRLPESFDTINNALNLFKNLLDNQFKTEIEVFGDFPSLFMGLVGKDGVWEHYGGHLRFTDSEGHIVADNLSEDDYRDFIGESVEKWSYLKFPYYKPLGYPNGIYRVGPLARLNICSHFGTPNADRELAEFRERNNGVATSSFLYHYARLIEILACLEHIAKLMDDPDLVSPRVRAQAGINQLEAIGVSEAPRGTLFHHYRVDENGLIQKVNLIIATGNNNLAMNKAIAQIAKHYIHSHEIPEGMLNRVEAGIRCYDPCLSCSTHAAGQMPLHIQLIGNDGIVVDEVYRD
jgi:NAD-reducing hydrogenase large subunit